MSQTTLERLEHLRRLNSNRQWVNHERYRLLYREDLYVVAYERIKSKPGNMTAGTDGETRDGVSLEPIREIIQDIRACFDELDHHILVTTRKKKIQDERCLNLIWKFLNAGYMDLHGEKKDSLIGSPQGGILSPILANVYLHELDEFVQELQTKLNKGRENT